MAKFSFLVFLSLLTLSLVLAKTEEDKEEMLKDKVVSELETAATGYHHHYQPPVHQHPAHYPGYASPQYHYGGYGHYPVHPGYPVHGHAHVHAHAYPAYHHPSPYAHAHVNYPVPVPSYHHQPAYHHGYQYQHHPQARGYLNIVKSVQVPTYVPRHYTHPHQHYA